MAFRAALTAAVALGTGRAHPETDASGVTQVESLAWLPAVGLLVGVLAAALARIALGLGAPAADAAGATALWVLGGDTRRSAIGIASGIASAFALAGLTGPERIAAFAVAPMLARWACVVQCYGGTAAPGARGLGALAGRARFREFGWASVTALATTLSLLDAVGLVVTLVSALVTIAIRVASYRRRRGIDDGAMNATSALVETSALVVLAAIAMWLRRG